MARYKASGKRFSAGSYFVHVPFASPKKIAPPVNAATPVFFSSGLSDFRLGEKCWINS
jgi:hypothetical protein